MANSEAAVDAAEVEIEEVVVVAIVEVVVADMLQAVRERRKTFSIYPNIWRRGLLSSSAVAEKVCRS